jgi:tripartite-type tricarboxylate transporter receptor subunit TctC
MNLKRIVMLSLFAFHLSSAVAADWPSHNLRILVPFPAGGSADIQARVIADELSKALEKPVIVENKPGAGGNLAAAEAARSAPDGYTLYMATTSTNATNVNLYESLPYDPVRDFQPLTLVTIYPQLVVPGTRFKETDLKSLINLLKREGDKLNFGSSGVGSPTHLAGELFNREVGVHLLHIPYRGQAPAMNDLLAGQIDMMFPSIPDALPMLQAGQIRPVAVMADKRSPLLPDVPTTAELGYPALQSAIWSALYTTTGTPKPVVDKLCNELVRIVESPAFKARFEAMGFEVRSSTPQELANFAASETRRWGDIIKALNIRLN